MFRQQAPIQPFDPDRYYGLRVDQLIDEDCFKIIAQPTSEGGRLMAHYYAHKYQTDIVIYNNRLDVFIRHIHGLLIQPRKETDDYRIAFLVNFGGTHTHPFIYIKEGKEEGLFYPNSNGLNIADVSIFHTLKLLQTNAQLPVYVITEKRQRDFLSCHTDGLLIARDCTARDPSTQQFRIPQLLTFLKSHSKSSINKVFTVETLPNELLKTAQIAYFVKTYQENDAKKNIHKNETLASFRARYSDPRVLVHKGIVKQDFPNYLRKKGLKLRNIIEIQFYLEQLAAHFPSENTPARRKEFITGAKMRLSKYPTIASDENQKHQELYRFALECFHYLKKEAQSKPAKPKTMPPETPDKRHSL